MLTNGFVRQKTLKTSIRCRGTALHSGDRVTMVFRPAAPDTGIVFRRTDRAGATLHARWSDVRESALCTTIDDGDGLLVATVEHVMAALAGLEIDNCVIELDGPEVPVMDGSAAPFVFLLECAGTLELDAPRRAIEVLKPVQVGNGSKSAALLPGAGLTLDMTIDFDARAIQHQNLRWMFDSESFKTDLAPARTFGFLEDVNALRAAGLARGGSMDNAIVIGDGQVLNREGLRFADEFVRHKALDALGDLYLAGLPIIGEFIGIRSGHAINRRLLEALFADRSAFRTVRMPADTYTLDWQEEEPRRVSA
ncbi:MAG TPA: UDP-3-O-acyl-N-acetylglucosamine deacetylase [Stellaceae bacterium]